MKAIFSIIVTFVLSIASAQAATVSFSPSSKTVIAGRPFSMNIMGSFLPGEAIEGGGLNMSFSPSALSVSNVRINTTLFDFYSLPGTINNAAGTISGMVFNTFAGASGNFLIATVDFMALGTGTSNLLLSQSSLNPFSSASAGPSLSVTYLPASIVVTAVPVPAAIWLLVSGMGLMGLGCKKKNQVS